MLSGSLLASKFVPYVSAVVLYDQWGKFEAHLGFVARLKFNSNLLTFAKEGFSGLFV